VLVSEPDEGISDGLNKGIALTRGRFVALIHADDWLSSGQLRCAIEALEGSGADYVFGDLIFHLGDQPVHVVRGDAAYTRRIDHIMPDLNHPTVIMRRESYERHGLFDTDYRLAMDYELLLRFHRAGLKGFYDPRLRGNMSLDGVSDRHAIRALAEVRAASIRYGYSPVKAWLRFLFRAIKTTMRRTLEKSLPIGITKTLRRLVNPAYRSAH
jgi:glycosyltransferase involved in cell wall biosynthesis